jgi:hypothetical protein
MLHGNTNGEKILVKLFGDQNKPRDASHILYTVYCIQYTVYSLLCNVYSIQYNVYSLLCTVYSIQYTVYTIMYTVYSIFVFVNEIVSS